MTTPNNNGQIPSEWIQDIMEQLILRGANALLGIVNQPCDITHLTNALSRQASNGISQRQSTMINSLHSTPKPSASSITNACVLNPQHEKNPSPNHNLTPPAHIPSPLHHDTPTLSHSNDCTHDGIGVLLVAATMHSNGGNNKDPSLKSVDSNDTKSGGDIEVDCDFVGISADDANLDREGADAGFHDFPFEQRFAQWNVSFQVDDRSFCPSWTMSTTGNRILSKKALKDLMQRVEDAS